MKDCAMWSMVGTKIYKKCAQVYKLEERIKELEAALHGMVPFIEEDFPNGTGVNHGTCATNQYQQACDAVIEALKG